MPNLSGLESSIFEISGPNDFNELALEIFQNQYKNNQVYNDFISRLSIEISAIKHFSLIPCLPIELFKSHKVMTGQFETEQVFISSGTTGTQTSKHFVRSLNLYEKSFYKTFETFFGEPENYVILALLPSYLERDGSSLIYMTEKLIHATKHPESGFYLDDYERLSQSLTRLNNQGRKVILLGVTYALLDMAEAFPIDFPELIIMETGGMKGRRKEMVRQELHDTLKKAFHVDYIFSEYGMTELLSQAYSLGEGLFQTPQWMKVLIRDTNDPFTLLTDHKTGGINVIDLANIHSCSFIATQDLGRLNSEGKFEVLGRYNNSDVRGCNLLLG